MEMNLTCTVCGIVHFEGKLNEEGVCDHCDGRIFTCKYCDTECDEEEMSPIEDVCIYCYE